MVGVMCMNSGVMSKVVEVTLGVCFLGSCVEYLESNLVYSVWGHV